MSYSNVLFKMAELEVRLGFHLLLLTPHFLVAFGQSATSSLYNITKFSVLFVFLLNSNIRCS